MAAPPIAPAPEDASSRPPLRVTSTRGRGGRRLAGPSGGPGVGGEPWLGDHPWRRDAADDETAREARVSLLVGGSFTLLASAGGAAILPAVEGLAVIGLALFLGLFLLVGLWLVARGVLSVQRRSRYGACQLRFSRFPYLLGERLDVTLVRDGATAPLPGLLARLVCVEEQWAVPGASDRAPRRRRVERWSETRPVPGAGGAHVPIRFDLPPPGPDAPGTELSAELPRYWELELWADLPGLDFRAVFLVPVYQRPAAGRGPAGDGTA
jgi:hypothetical protein